MSEKIDKTQVFAMVLFFLSFLFELFVGRPVSIILVAASAAGFIACMFIQDNKTKDLVFHAAFILRLIVVAYSLTQHFSMGWLVSVLCLILLGIVYFEYAARRKKASHAACWIAVILSTLYAIFMIFRMFDRPSMLLAALADLAFYIALFIMETAGLILFDRPRAEKSSAARSHRYTEQDAESDTEKLRELKRLFDRQLITEEEYKKEKARILG